MTVCIPTKSSLATCVVKVGRSRPMTSASKLCTPMLLFVRPAGFICSECIGPYNAYRQRTSSAVMPPD